MPLRSRPNLTAIGGSVGPSQPGGHDRSGIVAALQTAPAPVNSADITRAARATIAPHPDNARSALGDLTDTVNSIKSLGILTPLTVVSRNAYLTAHLGRRHNFDPGIEWVIIAGHRRYAAAEIAELHELPINVRDDLAGDETAVAAMLIENIHREGLTPLDEAAALQRLADGGMTQRDITKRTGITQSQVSKRLALLRLPANAQAGIAARTDTIQDAVRLLDLPPDYRAEAFDRHIAMRLSIDSCVKAELQRIQLESDIAVSRGHLDSEGIREIEPTNEFGADSWHHRLTEQFDIAKAADNHSLVASIDRHHGHLTYWTTAQQPWPWTVASTDSRGPATPDDEIPDSAESPSPENGELRPRPEGDLPRWQQLEQAKAARAARVAHIQAFLAGSPRGDTALELLTTFALLMAWDVVSARTTMFAGEAGGNFDKWMSEVCRRPGADRTRAALAIAFAGMEDRFIQLAAQPFSIDDYLPAVQEYVDNS